MRSAAARAPAIITSQPTVEQRLKWAAPRARPSFTTQAGFTQDHIDTRKAMWWCAACERRIEPARQGYKLKPKLRGTEAMVVRGNCDWCGEVHSGMRLWVHRSSPDANL